MKCIGKVDHFLPCSLQLYIFSIKKTNSDVIRVHMG